MQYWKNHEKFEKIRKTWKNDDFYPHTCRKSTFWVTQTAQTLQNLNFLDKCEDKNHHFFKFSDFFEFFAIFPILQIYFCITIFLQFPPDNSVHFADFFWKNYSFSRWCDNQSMNVNYYKKLNVMLNPTHFPNLHAAAANRMIFFDNCNRESSRSRYQFCVRTLADFYLSLSYNSMKTVYFHEKAS